MPAPASCQDVRLPSCGNAHIFAESHAPSHSVATLLVCHGIGEHSDRYLRFINQLVDAGIRVVRLDLRGHGRSTGRRGHVNDFADYLDDLHCVLSHFADNPPIVPWFLFGHSMGGVIVTEYLLSHAQQPPIRGLVLSSPGFAPKVPISRLKGLLSRLLLPFFPWLRFPTGIRPDHLSSNPDAQRKFKDDPRTYAKVSLRWYAEFQRAGLECLERAHELTLPMYVCVGTDDPVVSPEGARLFVDRANSDDKTLCTHDGMLHEPLNENDGEQVGAAIIEWILGHVPG